MTYKEIKWTPEEIDTIRKRGEISAAAADAAMSRSGINFDDIEDINGHYERHRWGSNTDRAYRKRAIAKAVASVARNAAAYLPGVDRKRFFQEQALNEITEATRAYEKAVKRLPEGSHNSRNWEKILDRYNAAFETAEHLGISMEEQTAAVDAATV